MIPEGLVLLTSLAFAGRDRHARAPARARAGAAGSRGPGRVDIVLLDKTGTITEGEMRFDAVEVIGEGPEADRDVIADALAALAAGTERNQTMRRSPRRSRRRPAGVPGATPFSSARKWSAISFGEQGTWVFGAPEMVWRERAADDPVRGAASNGTREPAAAVLLLAHARRPRRVRSFPRRSDGPRWCCSRSASVPTPPTRSGTSPSRASTCKVVSGDSPATVGAVAARVGMPGADHPVDGRTCPRIPRRWACSWRRPARRTGDAAPEASDRRRAPTARATWSR